ncbi:hypothetical protein KCU95_g3427, partial [Aureobasidium melanogenum]
MSDAHNPTAARTWWWIIVSCVSTLVPANNTIIRPDPVLSWWKRKLLYLVLQFKTLLFPQLVLWEAVTHFICARIVRDRVNAAARQSRCAYLAAHGPQPTLTEAPEQVAPEPEPSWISNLRMWLSRGYKLFCGNTVTTLRLEYDNGNGNVERIDFEEWTTKHGQCAIMGAFSVELPPTAGNPDITAESQASQEWVSLKPQQLFALLESNDPRKARFDLFEDVHRNQVEGPSMNAIPSIARLLVFVYHCYKRQQFGLEFSPLEVMTVGHVFLALMIEAFWWDRPAEFRYAGGIPLNREKLCQAIPRLRRELEGHAAAAGRPTTEAYTSAWTFNIRQWLPQQDQNVMIRMHANYRAITVFTLAACHSAILWLVPWRLSFPTPTERDLWDGFLRYCFLCSCIVAPLAAFDTIVRHVAEKSPHVRELYGAVLDGTPDNKQTKGLAGTVREWTNDWILPLVLIPVFMCLPVVVVVAGVNFRQPSPGVFVAGPGDLSNQNFTLPGSI